MFKIMNSQVYNFRIPKKTICVRTFYDGMEFPKKFIIIFVLFLKNKADTSFIQIKYIVFVLTMTRRELTREFSNIVIYGNCVFLIFMVLWLM